MAVTTPVFDPPLPSAGVPARSRARAAAAPARRWLIKFHSDRRRDSTELGKIGVETFVLLRQQVGDMEEKIVKLRDRVDALEEQLEIKEVEIQQKQSDIDILKRQFNDLKNFVRGLLDELDEKGVEYTKPPAHLLDTDPRMPPIRGGKK